MHQKTEIDWAYYTNSTTACQSIASGCFWPRGKVLGGTSTINALFYARGKDIDHDNWAKLGHKGWDYESVLPFYKKSEGNLQEKLVNYQNGRYHNASGPVKVDYYSELNEVQKLIVAAAIERGHSYHDDMNADKRFGYWNSQATFANARRQSTARSFLLPAGNRPNLHIIKKAMVKKVIINENNEAVGVEFDIQTRNGRRAMKAMAKKEVIVSAGAVNSPQLLMLSGVGPSEQLNKFNIPIKMELENVGKNLLDHIYVMSWFKFTPPSIAASLEIIANSGLFSHPLQLMGFINTVNETVRPDVELIFFFIPPNAMDLVILLESLDLNFEIKQTLYNANKLHYIGAFGKILLHPKSHGTIELNGSDPYEKPLIYPNYFNHSDDMETLVRAVKEQHSYVDTNAYKSLNVEFIKLPIPECDKYEYASDDYWRCYNKHMSISIYHAIGTCRMGTKKTGVVDDQLKVHGIEKLRVIDASMYVVNLFNLLDCMK